MDIEDAGPSADILKRIARIVVPWVSLILVVTIVYSLVMQYQSSKAEPVSAPDDTETTGTVDTTGTAGSDDIVIPEGEAYVVVLMNGLSMRATAEPTGQVLKTLAADQKLLLVDRASGWYLVRDGAGAQGWVAAGGTYTQLVEP